jgi:type I restriction enzyme S subunit
MTRLKAYVSNPVERLVDPDLPYVSLEQIESGTGRLLPGIELEGNEADDSIAHRPGDVRFGKLRPYLSKSLLAAEPGVGSGELLVLRPDSLQLDARFLWYLTLSRLFVEWATANSYGVKMPRTSWQAVASFDVSLPPLDEQRGIVAFLDIETGRIDGLVTEQEHLLSLVAEKAAADREWAFAAYSTESRPLIAYLQQPPTYGVLVPSFEDSGVPFIRVGDIAGIANGLGPERFITEVQSQEYRRTILQADDVLVSVVGSLGHSAVVPAALAGANVARAVCLLRPARDVPSDVLAEFVKTRLYQDQAVLATGTDTAQPTLNMGDIAKFKVPMPADPAERASLTQRLSALRVQARVLRHEFDGNLRLLRERRQALITAAVTGGLEAVGRAA